MGSAVNENDVNESEEKPMQFTGSLLVKCHDLKSQFLAYFLLYTSKKPTHLLNNTLECSEREYLYNFILMSGILILYGG